MDRASTREQIRVFAGSWRRKGQSIALVPTMGNLHDGHIALVSAARRQADRVVASIYVNPTQFGPGEDFANYPRTLEADLVALESVGCDLAFVPDDACMYPGGIGDSVEVQAPPSLSRILEGEVRPGHFDGVVSVVSRLFNLVTPDVALFGEKDYQQLLVIRRMVEDLGYAVRIDSVATVREASGLALSSRNRYLSTDQREAAGSLSAILHQAAARLRDRVDERETVEREAAGELERRGFRVDYFVVRCATNLSVPGPADKDLRILAAAWCGPARLIDNVACVAG